MLARTPTVAAPSPSIPPVDRDALLRPVGPLPPHVYWARRALLCAAVVAAALIVVSRLAGSGGAHSPEAGPSRHPSGPTTSSHPASSSPAPGTSRPLEPVASCVDSALSVTGATDRASYPPGAAPLLAIRIRNNGATPCRRDIGPGARGLTVLSGADRIWSSDDCEGTAMAVVTLAPGDTRSYSLRWSRHRSRRGCPGPGPAARPGVYRLYASLGRIAARPAVFSLR